MKVKATNRRFRIDTKHFHAEMTILIMRKRWLYTYISNASKTVSTFPFYGPFLLILLRKPSYIYSTQSLLIGSVASCQSLGWSVCLSVCDNSKREGTRHFIAPMGALVEKKSPHFYPLYLQTHVFTP